MLINNVCLAAVRLVADRCKVRLTHRSTYYYDDNDDGDDDDEAEEGVRNACRSVVTS